MIATISGSPSRPRARTTPACRRRRPTPAAGPAPAAGRRPAGQGGPVAALPGHVGLGAQAQQQVELLLEQRVVVVQVQPEQGKASVNDPRPTTRSMRRARSGRGWRTAGRRAPGRWRSAPRRRCPGGCARCGRRAAARMTGGAESKYSSRWCSPIPKECSPTRSASSISSRRWSIRSTAPMVRPAAGVDDLADEAVDADVHGVLLGLVAGRGCTPCNAAPPFHPPGLIRCPVPAGRCAGSPRLPRCTR